MKNSNITSFVDLFDANAQDLLEANGSDLIKRIGFDTARTIVLDVLTGRNIRDSTEMLTRGRLAALNLASVDMLLKGMKSRPDFIQRVPEYGERILRNGRLSRSEAWLAQWALGLTSKASQNVLRDDATLLTEYRLRYEKVCGEAVKKAITEYGSLRGDIYLNDNLVAQISWEFMVYLLALVGAQTLTIRGSEKSLYGKLFEKLILGSLLSILGFNYTDSGAPSKFSREFWLSSTGERESDATVLWEAGKGARFDIGFIGRGNTEISLDKVSRFKREIELGHSTWYMATIVIVDRIGANSSISELARLINGDIVQMSMSYWPQEVAQILSRKMGFRHPLVKMPHNQIHDYLEETIQSVAIEAFLPNA